eukprot:TRINITY_DN11576_c0_g1_i1.p1 TRINITY_DN11576_c0_g1~~TRINITY_DN11576_c0_g1_i1.p1  ORF type:complete len:399 (-),score=108.30 TRINITY_DN11576_c0_g1_i1:13-1209(-)
MFYVHFDEGSGTPDFALKEDSAQWSSGKFNVEELIYNFVNAYNQKFEDQGHILDPAFVRLVSDSKKPFSRTESLANVVRPKGDLFIVRTADRQEVTPVVKQCGNRGCGKDFNVYSNEDNSCQFHPGNAVFHEGLKYWACCPRSSKLTMEEMLAIPGCASGRHSRAPERPKPVPKKESTDSSVKLVSADSGVEVYKSASSAVPPPKPADAAPVVEAPPPVVEVPDPVDAVIAPGTKCRHSGCTATFEGDESRTAACEYHPGVPIFHEGSKGWSCCKRKVLEFDEFLKIEPCSVGRHKFVEPPKVAGAQVPCRFDFFQTGPAVTVTIYAKNVVKEQSTVTIQPDKLFVDLKFKDGTAFTKDFNLAGRVVADKAKYEILSTKVEIRLPKADTANWTSLERK